MLIGGPILKMGFFYYFTIPTLTGNFEQFTFYSTHSSLVPYKIVKTDV